MQRAPTEFAVLGDEPVERADEDLLGVADTAAALVALITGSRASAPFTVAIDAGWGMGKSSLMRLMRTRLETDGVPTAWFNAWTSGPDALEVLIKSVLLRFDRNVVRRAYHRLARRRGAVRAGRLALALMLGLVGLRRIVDAVWEQLSADAKSRDEIRDAVREMAREWVRDGGPDGRQLVIFVDDLDRCSAQVVLTVCEAIKLYLDVPGLVFVIGCDQGALSRNLRGDGASAQAAEYLEKIVQVNYRAPVPDRECARRLVEGYLRRAGTSELFGEQLTALLVLRAKRNPRRIKRLLNGFVLEYHLDRRWREIGPAVLLRIILLQHFYPDFHQLLAWPDGRDPVPEFLGYAAVRDEVRRGGVPADRAPFTSLGVPVPGAGGGPQDWSAAVERLEQELPVQYPGLAGDRDFLALVRELREDEGYRRMRDEVPRRQDEVRVLNIVGAAELRIPTGIWEGRAPGDVVVDHATQPNDVGLLPHLGGLRVLWVDDAPTTSDGRRAEMFTARGATVEFAADLDGVRAALRNFEPELIVSDITRADDEYAGLDEMQALRHAGDYAGPVIFYVARVTPNRLRRAKAMGAEGVTGDPAELLEWVAAVARRLRKDRPVLPVQLSEMDIL